MKKLVLIIVLFFAFSNVSAIQINEVESNPLNKDAGNEWIEFYSDEEVELEDYKIVNNDGNELELSGSFSGYYVYVFAKQWLDNSDEKVFLYKNGELIDETSLFNDDKNDGLSWQFCDSWEFAGSTKGEENFCEEEIKEPEKVEDKKEENTTKLVLENQEEASKENKFELIKLNPKDIKSEDNEEVEDDGANKSEYAVYVFVVFCVLIVVLFLFRKKKYKNEFE